MRAPQQFEALAWDSQFFGFPVARIVDPSLDAAGLSASVAAMRAAGIRLGYWAAERALPERDLPPLGGRHVDDKTTFVIDLGASVANASADDARVSIYRGGADEDLEALAIESGRESRFAVDPNIERAAFESLYRLWMRRSLSGDLAEAVLVVTTESRPAGMVTVASKGARGSIGLIAVAPEHRGRGIGRALVGAAQRWARSRGFGSAQVITQGTNKAACELYARCGYRVERVEPFYHFWL